MRPNLIRPRALPSVDAAPARGLGGGDGPRGAGSNSASYTVFGDTASRGRGVAPCRAANPSATARDGFGTRGNGIPHAGAAGTRGAGQ